MKIRKENNKKNTKKTLALSVLSGALSFAMLAGSTYAWFYDSASAQNIISTGNLDIELKHLTSEGVADINENTKLFQKAGGGEIMWEPGAVATETFIVENVGNLNLKYDFALGSKEDGIGPENDKAYLNQYLKVAVLEATIDGNGTVTPASAAADRESIKEITDWENLATVEKESAELAAGAKKAYTVVVYWAPNANDVDNQFNLTDGYEVNLSIDLEATQTTGESDSFDDQYDSGAYDEMPNGGGSGVDEGETEDPLA